MLRVRAHTPVPAGEGGCLALRGALWGWPTCMFQAGVCLQACGSEVFRSRVCVAGTRGPTSVCCSHKCLQTLHSVAGVCVLGSACVSRVGRGLELGCPVCAQRQHMRAISVQGHRWGEMGSAASGLHFPGEQTEAPRSRSSKGSSWDSNRSLCDTPGPMFCPLNPSPAQVLLTRK